MKKKHINVFLELIQATKAVIRTVWGTSGIEGLTAPQFAILLHLNHRGPLSPSELSDILLVTQGNVTGLIQRMQKQGLVERRRSSSDRRVLKIGITRAGAEKLDVIRPTWEKMVQQAIKPLNQDEQETLQKLLGKLREGLSNGQPCPCFPGFGYESSKKSFSGAKSL